MNAENQTHGSWVRSANATFVLCPPESMFAYQCVVTAHGQENEVERIDETLPGSTLGLDAHVHDLVPILAG